VYADRVDAGRRLAEVVAARYPALDDAVVLGLPRGGVPVAAEVARLLGAPLDVVVARKLGVPGSPEVAMGAIASVGGELAIVANDELRVQVERIEGADAWAEVLAREQRELERRVTRYRGARPPLQLEGRTVLLVDDGIATGATMRAAALAARQLAPTRLVAAAPVALSGAGASVGASVDDLVCPWNPPTFMGVGQAYLDFAQTEDDEVRRLLGTE
jgi:putative phosphoribosyl transferase